MDSREERGRSGEKHRSYLVLSSILLLWHCVVFCTDSFRNLFPPAAGSSGRASSLAHPSSPAADAVAAATPRAGPPTLRQEYLLGKRIDINKASQEEIAALPGISEATAAAVVAARKRRGGFRSPDELLEVKGIKEKRLKKILPFLAGMKNN
ncbi:MAG: ComEA family DNA-binding protein [Verrucomicrobiota bacterium]